MNPLHRLYCFPSGLTVAGARREAELMLKLGRHTHMVAALNHIAVREMGLNWIDAINKLAFIDKDENNPKPGTSTKTNSSDDATPIINIKLGAEDSSIVDSLFLDAAFADELAGFNYEKNTIDDDADSVFSHLTQFDDAYTHKPHSHKKPNTCGQTHEVDFIGLSAAERAAALSDMYLSQSNQKNSTAKDLNDSQSQNLLAGFASSHLRDNSMTPFNTETSATTNHFSTAAFIELALSLKVLKFGEFELKSGRISPYFFNAGLLNNGEALGMLASGFAQCLSTQIEAETDVVFGAAYKGIPFVAATAQALYTEHDINVGWGFNRKEAKAHGEGGQMVGAPVAGKSVWVIDDVMTAGTAMREVISLLESEGASIAGIIIALDRKEKGVGDTSAIDEFRAQGYKVQALVSIEDIIDYLQNKNDTEALTAMQAYRKTYGVA